MRFGIKCKVDSNTEIGTKSLQATINGRDYTLTPSEVGLLNELTVVTKVESDKDFISYVSPSVGLTIDYDRQIYDSLIDMMQYIEASLSFLLGVKKIYWEDAEKVFIPENEEEKKKYNVMSYSLKRSYHEERVRLTLSGFTEIIQQKSKTEPLKMIKLFHKEGVREFTTFRFVNAYYNFYFVLEDLYAQGKTNNQQVEQKFKSDQTLKSIIQYLLSTVIKGKHLTKLQDFLREENKTFSVDGILELIVQVRGNLHHYSGKSTKRKGTPLNQGDFETMAFLLMGVSLQSIIHATFKQ